MSVQFYLLTACSKDRHVVSKNAKYNCIIAGLDEIYIKRNKSHWQLTGDAN